MKNPHVLVLNHFATPIGTPGGTRHIELFERLPSSWTFTIVASNRSQMDGSKQIPSAHFEFVPVTSYRGNGISRILNWVSYAVSASIRSLQLRPRPDFVYGSSPHLLAGLAAWFVATVRGSAFILEVRDLWPQVLVDMGRISDTSVVYRSLTSLEMFLYRKARRIVVMAEGTRQSLITRGIPEEKLVYIPNGADPEDFNPGDSRDRLRADFKFTKLTAVYAGAHGPANGLDLLLSAASELKGHDLDIVLAGDGIEKAKLELQARDMDLPNLRFIAPVPKSRMGDLLTAADIGLHVLADVDLFRTSVSPNKVFDYMAAGLPVLTNCPGLVTDLVESSGAGIGTDPRGLAEGLIAMSQMTESSRATMSESGRSWIRDNQSRREMSLRLLSALEETRSQIAT